SETAAESSGAPATAQRESTRTVPACIATSRGCGTRCNSGGREPAATRASDTYRRAAGEGTMGPPTAILREGNTLLLTAQAKRLSTELRRQSELRGKRPTLRPQRLASSASRKCCDYAPWDSQGACTEAESSWPRILAQPPSPAPAVIS